MIKNRQNTKHEAPAWSRLNASLVTALSAHKTMLGALTSLLLVAQAPADSFVFSTGEPDGKIATLSRPAGTDRIQTETADDFLLTQPVVINQATFIGLLPAGATAASVGNVEIEFYHVFPGDSDTNRTPNVPTRLNSPGDVEIDDATRDGFDGSLSFVATLVNASFTASNSVVTGIHAGSTPFTGGEGPVSGAEIAITVSFNPPISLPPGHYFFRPEVESGSGDFMWLSAPRPILAPGTPFLPDLQSWIRNDTLAPDWLRIGTDITHQGPFNAAFSLIGETDQDGDGVADSADQCPGTPAGAIVDADGCSIDQIAPCSGPAAGGTWKNHGQYVSSVAQAAEAFVLAGLISEEEAEQIASQAAQSDCGTTSK